jgi:hypothetical protein
VVTGGLNIPLRKLLCCEDTPGGPCCLRPAHKGSHLPTPKRAARSANDEKEPE